MFPAIAMKLLGFVALYGLILMPMGAVIFVDFWLASKLGLADSYAERTGTSFNWAAGLTWFLTLAICLALVQFAGIQIYFVSLPGWFIACALYVALSKLYQKPQPPHANPRRSPPPHEPHPTRRPGHVLASPWPPRSCPRSSTTRARSDLDTMKAAMLLATIAWFVTAPLWMGRDPDPTAPAQ